MLCDGSVRGGGTLEDGASCAMYALVPLAVPLLVAVVLVLLVRGTGRKVAELGGLRLEAAAPGGGLGTLWTAGRGGCLEPVLTLWLLPLAWLWGLGLSVLPGLAGGEPLLELLDLRPAGREANGTMRQ